MWWIVGSLLATLLGVAIWLLVFHDGPPPDDRMMLPLWTRQGAKEVSPLAVFIGELDKGLFDVYNKLPQDVRELQAGSESAVRKFVVSQGATYAAFDRLMQSDLSTWSWPAGAKLADSLGSSMDDFQRCASLPQTLRMRIHALMLDGKTEEATLLSLKMARCGSGLFAAEGDFNHVTLGFLFQSKGREGLQKSLSESSPNRKLLSSCLRELNDIKHLGREDIQFAFRMDYIYFKNSVLKMDRWQFAGPSSPRLPGMENLWRYATPVLFKPNRTLAKRVDLERPVIEGLGRSWKGGYDAFKEINRFSERTRAVSGLARYLNPNYGGEAVLAMSMDSSSSVVEMAMSTCGLFDQTRVMLALRIFEMDKGRLPERLDELVPGYLPVIPEDTFTGKPMLWSAEKQVVYSAGPDGIDDGGMVNEEKPRKGADVGMRYWWKDKPFEQAPNDESKI
jgi:hypothetical protein